jgi:hypothetical protein
MVYVEKSSRGESERGKGLTAIRLHLAAYLLPFAGAIIAKQQKQIKALTVGLQKVSAQIEASKSAPQVVNNNQ